MGVGMVALVPPDTADAAVAVLAAAGVTAWVGGEVAVGAGAALRGAYGTG